MLSEGGKAGTLLTLVSTKDMEAVLILGLKSVSIFCTRVGEEKRKNNRQTDKQSKHKIEP